MKQRLIPSCIVLQTLDQYETELYEAYCEGKYVSSSTLRLVNYLRVLLRFQTGRRPKQRKDQVIKPLSFRACFIALATMQNSRPLKTFLSLKHTSRKFVLINLKCYFRMICCNISLYEQSRVIEGDIQEKCSTFFIEDDYDYFMAHLLLPDVLPGEIIFILMFYLGLEDWEIWQLRPEDVNLEEDLGTIQVVNKKRNRYRRIRLDTTSRDILERYLSSLPPASLYLFPSKTGASLTVRTIRNIAESFIANAQLPHICTHNMDWRFGHRVDALRLLRRQAQLQGSIIDLLIH